MRLGGQVHQGVEARPVQLQDLGIHPTGEVADEHPLGSRRDVLRADKGLHTVEILRVAALMAVNLGQSDDGGHIAAVQGKGFLVTHLRQGIRELAQIIVAGDGEDRGRCIFLVELLQHFNGFVLPAHGVEDVVAGADHLLRRTPLPLDVVQGLESLVELLLLQVDIQQFVHRIAAVGEILYQGFVEGGTFFRLPVHQVQAGQHTAIPVVAAVQGHGLFQGGLGGVQVIGRHLGMGQVIPHGVVVRCRRSQ